MISKWIDNLINKNFKVKDNTLNKIIRIYKEDKIVFIIVYLKNRLNFNKINSKILIKIIYFNIKPIKDIISHYNSIIEIN